MFDTFLKLTFRTNYSLGNSNVFTTWTPKLDVNRFFVCFPFHAYWVLNCQLAERGRTSVHEHSRLFLPSLSAVSISPCRTTGLFARRVCVHSSQLRVFFPPNALHFRVFVSFVLLARRPASQRSYSVPDPDAFRSFVARGF